MIFSAFNYRSPKKACELNGLDCTVISAPIRRQATPTFATLWPSNIRSRAARRSLRARPVLGVGHTVVDRLLLLPEQILEDELAPNAAACVHQRATLVELSQLDGGEAELFGQGRHWSGRVLVVARQKDDPVPALDDRIGSQGGRNEMIESFHELGAGERLRDEGGGRETVQLFKGNSKRVRRVDDRLAF